MPIRCGSRSGPVSYSRFQLSGGDSLAHSGAPDDALFDCLREHLLVPRFGEPQEIASGFCTNRHVFDGEFTYESCGFGASLLAAMRVDRAEVPTEIKRAYRVMAEDSRRERAPDGSAVLLKSQKLDARQEAEERCKKDLSEGKYRRVGMVPFLWDLPTGLLLAPLTSDKQTLELKSLLEAACNLRLERRSAGTLAFDLLSARGQGAALEDALPDALVKRPEGPERVDQDDADVSRASEEFRRRGRPEVPWALSGGEPNDFLGNVFLLWLWWHCDAHEGLIDAGAVTVALAIEKGLDMECAWGVTGSQVLRGDAPTQLSEASKALQTGKWPRKMSLLIAAHGQEFRCTLQGDRFSVHGLTLPEAEDERRLSPRQHLEHRVDTLLTFDRLLVLLFDSFLKERFSPVWETRTGQLRKWITERGEKRQRSARVIEIKPDSLPVGP